MAARLVGNPFEHLRVSRGWSQNECAAKIGVDVRAIARLEHGLYTAPLPSAVSYWVNLGAINVPELLTAYEDFVYATRRDNYRHFGNLHVNLSDGVHPWRNIRASKNPLPSASLTGCAKVMCVPLDTLQFWEKKWRTQKTVPKSILLALNQMGYTQIELAKFSEVYVAWRNIHLADAKPTQPRRRQIKQVTPND